MEDDDALMAAWRAGDRAAGAALLHRHFDALFRFFANKVSDRAEDLVQETLLAAVEQRERFEGSSSFRTYLLAIAKRRLYRHWRGRGVEHRLDEQSVSELTATNPTPAESLARHQEHKLLLRALRRLPLPLQILLELSYFEGMTDRQLAELEQLPIGTIKSRLRKGRQLLDAAMRELGPLEVLRSTTEDFDGWVGRLRAGVTPDAAAS